MRLTGAVLLALVVTVGVATAPADARVVEGMQPGADVAVVDATHASATTAGDPDWVFYTQDKARYTSPWYQGGHRIMIGFGCTEAPYYSPDPRCTNEHGFHHGIDIAMKCGTPLFARKRGWVVSNDALGSAYGANPLRLRNYEEQWDVVIGHTRKVFVEPGDRIHQGDRLARASDDAAPDGCHLHFEKRALAGGLASAVHPRKLLRLRPRKKS